MQGQQKSDDSATKLERHRKSFERYIQTGIKAAMEVGTDSEGGFRAGRVLH